MSSPHDREPQDEDLDVELVDDAELLDDDDHDDDFDDDDLGDDGALGGGLDLDGLLQQALAMQQQLSDAQAAAAEQRYEGQAGGGAVRLLLSGTGELLAVRIHPSVVDEAEVEVLEDLIVAAWRDAAERVAGAQSAALGDLGALGGDLGRLLGGQG